MPEHTAAHALVLVRALAARRLRRLRRPQLHVVGWGALDAAAAGELRAGLSTAPVLLLDPAGRGSMRDMLDAAVDDCVTRGRDDRPPKLARYRIIVRMLGGELGVNDVLPPPRTWWERAVPPFLTVAGVATAVMQGAGAEHQPLWWLGLAMFVAAIAVGSLHGVARPLLNRRWMRRLLGPDAADWFERQRQGRGADPDVNRLLARAFLLDLRAEWGWGTLLSWRRMRVDHPVLLLPGDGTDLAGVFLEEYARLAAPPVLLVTDRPGGTPIDVDGLARRPDGPWRAGPVLVPPPGPGSGRLRAVYRRGIAPAGTRLSAFVLVPALAAVLGVVAARPPSTCSGPFEPDVVVTDRGERVGVQYCGDSFAAASDTEEQQIYRQNREVRRRHPDRAVTIVLLTSLTQDPQAGPERSVLAEREGLAGAYAAQMSINSAPGVHPLVQLAIANAGYHAQHIGEVTDRLHAKLRGDPRMLAAVATVDSTEPVQQALQRLADQSLVLASPTMTADDLPAKVPNFLQITSSNSEQVELVAGYAAHAAPGAPIDVVTMASAPGDRYVATLAGAAQRSGMRLVPWSPGEAGTDLTGSCGGTPAPVVYYAARYDRFPDFVDNLRLACGGRHPLLVADDSVSRFLADDSLTSHLPHGTDVVVTVRGDLLSCRGLAAPATAAERAEGVAARRADLLDDFREYLGRCRDTQDRLTDLAGGWAVTVYDIVRMLYDATRRVTLATPGLLKRTGAAPRAALAGLLLRQDPAAGHTYPGSVEPLRWDAGGAAHRSLSLLCIPELRTPFAGTAPVPAPVAWRRHNQNGYTTGPDDCAAGR
ncbi:hypothetical protein [Dactylosporangium sp. CA-092794]|uniref:hypothetical protein n=1 Tax=Dactylosporangium sp. CA-092794 TaxID=3239929 RepID=UPI003D90216F